MRNTHRKILWTPIIFLLLLIAGTSVFAAFPSPQGFINDFANILDQRSRTELEQIARGLQSEQGIELAVVTIATTEPLDPKEYTTALFSEWGIGGPEDSGLLMLLSVAEGAIEVEPGYGLEGALPDGLIGAVIDQEGIPHFVNRDYSTGLTNMAKAYASILAGEEFEVAERREEGSNWLASFVIFIVIIMLLNRNRRHPPSGGAGGGGGGSRRTVFVPTRMPRGGGFGGGSRPSGGFGGGRSGGGGAGRRF